MLRSAAQRHSRPKWLYVARLTQHGTYVDVDVRVGFIRILSERYDLCRVLEENAVAVQCPLPPGEYDVSHTALLPKQIPPAKYSVHITGATHMNKPLACLDVKFSFSFLGAAVRSWWRS